ncbi:hypothetical protein WAF17_08555 [Bernardetia sp. ABR2-2B]|uniref:hypothetical protein n=1 Tax=Bernardetia sp. ABR2-2B TaxID=3127472 RepID=UPI0030CD3371
MKESKNIFKIILITILVCSFALTSCKDNEVEVDCDALTTQSQDAWAEYYQGIKSDANCKAYKKSLQANIDAHCWTKEEEETAKNVVESLPCD